MRQIDLGSPLHGTRWLAPLLAVGLLGTACAPAAPSPTAAPAKPAADAPAAKTAPSEPAAKTAPAAPAETKPVAKVSLKSAYTSTAGPLVPITAAKEGGYFDEEGLDVSLSRIQAGAPILAAMRGGDVPIAFAGGQQIVEADLQGGDFIIVAGFTDTFGQSIVVLPSIENAEQLKGQALGITNFGAITHVAGKLGTEHLGLKDQVTFVATGGPPETIAAMQAGKVQGAILSPPDLFVARDLGFREILDVAKLPYKSQGSSVVTTKGWAQQNPDLVERYIRAAIKGTHRMVTDRDFGIKAIGKHSGLEDARVLEETYDYYRDQYSKDGYPSKGGVQGNLDVAAAEIPAAKTATPEQFWDLTYLDKIKASGFLEKLWGRL